MKYFTTRMVSLLLTFGIFFAVSCTVFEKSQNEEQVSVQDQMLQRMDQIDQQIIENPDNPELKFRKGELLLDMADLMVDPTDRNPIYRNLFDLSMETDLLQPLVVQAWSEEQNSGVRLLQSDRNDDTVDHYNDILAHFNNAVILQPDSLVTYSLLATTYYENGSIHQAIETLESAIEISDQDEQEFQEKLAYLYLEAGRTDISVNMYENLVSESPDNHHLLHGLINAYILSNRHEDAILILKGLTDEYPARYSYHEALAAQLYFRFKNSSEHFINGTDDQDERSADQLIQWAIEIDELFNLLISSTPINEENIYRMATFYRNSAGLLINLSEHSDDVESKQEFDRFATDHSEKSLSYWERLLEMDPDNLEYITVLHQLYLDNGMIEEADSIERSYNF